MSSKKNTQNKLLAKTKSKLVDLLYEEYYNNPSSNFFLANNTRFNKELKNRDVDSYDSSISKRVDSRLVDGTENVESTERPENVDSKRNIGQLLRTIRNGFRSGVAYRSFLGTLYKEIAKKGNNYIQLNRIDKPKDVDYFINIRNRIPSKPGVYFQCDLADIRFIYNTTTSSYEGTRYNYMLVLIDAFSGYIRIALLQNKNANSTARAIENLFEEDILESLPLLDNKKN